MDRYRMLPSYHYYDVEGNSPLTLDKSVGKALRDYKIYGNSVQDGTPTPENPVEIKCVGDKTKNLFDASKISGWGYTVNDDKSITVSSYGTASNTTLRQACPKLKAGDVCIFSGTTTGNMVNGINLWTGSGVVSWNFGTVKTITEEMLEYRLTFYSSRVDGVNSDALYDKIQIEYGETVTEHEPYGYKIPVEVGGKNLFDIDTFLSASGNSTYYSKNDNGELVMLKGDYRSISQISCPITLSKGTYTLSFSNSAFTNYYVFANGVKIGEKNFTLTETTDVSFKAWGDNETVLGYVQIELGSATEYEPYKEPIATNIYLDEPLYKIGDYADYIDKINSKVVRNIGSCLLKVTANLNITHDTLAGFYYRTSDRTSEYDTTVVEALSPSLLGIPRNSGISNYNTPAISADTTNRAIRFYLLKETIGGDTSALAQAYLNDNPITAYYILDTPVEEDITLPPINTHKGTNIISVGTEIQPSNIKIQYYK